GECRSAQHEGTAMTQPQGVAMTRVAPPAPPLSPGIRRMILGIAFLIALAVSLPHESSPARAQDGRPATPTVPAAPASPPMPKAPGADEKKGHDASISIRPGSIEIKTPSTDQAKSDADLPASPATTAPSTTHSVTIEKGGKKVEITGLGSDREFDSFGEFVHDEPALAGMVVAIVAVVFLSPVLAIALILWYRMRKARMLNDTMLTLAEKGLVPPAEALSALTGNAAAAMATGSSTAPIYEQAKQLRRRAAWSDLRKGVIMGAIGFGLVLHSMLGDRTPNVVGLVLLFVGIGYAGLWWFEQRRIEPKSDAGGGAAPGA
ncbi:MAG: DUF6249 domain-containing protein, partial [Betaproteobacteria bacterium]